jgi:hypothetical protein
MRYPNRAEMTRLTLCAVIVLVAVSLSAVTFYYCHIRAPQIPLVVGLVAVLPIGYILDDLRRLFKVKKTQESHHPPNRS